MSQTLAPAAPAAMPSRRWCLFKQRDYQMIKPIRFGGITLNGNSIYFTYLRPEFYLIIRVILRHIFVSNFWFIQYIRPGHLHQTVSSQQWSNIDKNLFWGTCDGHAFSAGATGRLIHLRVWWLVQVVLSVALNCLWSMTVELIEEKLGRRKNRVRWLFVGT